MNKKIILISFLLLLLIVIFFSIIKIEMFENHGNELSTHSVSVLNSIIDEFKVNEYIQMNHKMSEVKGYDDITYMRGLTDFSDRNGNPTNLVLI